MKRLLVLLVAVALLTPQAVAAQHEGQIWLDAGVQYRPVKKLRLGFTQHLRLDQDVSRLESVKSDLTIAWAFAKWFRLGFGYRFTMESNKKDVLEQEHRLHLQGQFQYSVGPVKLAYRLRFQEAMAPEDDGLKLKHTLRNRLGAEFDTDTLATPGVSIELFTRLADEDGPIVVTKVRLTAGLELAVVRDHTLDIYYRVHVPIADADDPYEHIAGLGYRYRIR
jgi:hypothetical protein